jgi:hypothetical protein
VPSSTTSSATWVERAAGECWSYADLLSPSVVRCYTPPSPISEGCRCKVSLVSGEVCVSLCACIFELFY